MSTNTGGIAGLYANVVADLQAYYDNAVLLPNSTLIPNSINISGGAGDTVQFPLQTAFAVGTSGLTEMQDIVTDAANDFAATGFATARCSWGTVCCHRGHIHPASQQDWFQI